MGVYLVKIGKFIKIGFSNNLMNRLRVFRTSNAEIDLLLEIPEGDKALERRLHRLLSEVRIARREIFRSNYRLSFFIQCVKRDGLQNGLDFLQSTTPQERTNKKRQDREKRDREKRMTKAQLDANFAILVKERKRHLGW